MADLAVATNENLTPDSKILIRNSISWSTDVEMGSIPLSWENAFHFLILIVLMSLAVFAFDLVAV